MGFIATFFLNFIASYLFWKVLFKKQNLAFVGAILTVFSPYINFELSHFQMMSFWPMFISLYFLIKDEKRRDKKNLLFSGLFLAIQFLSSVYLAIFLTFIISVYLVVSAYFDKKLIPHLKSALYIFGVFVIIDSVFIYKYFETQKLFNIQRSYGEYVTYSSHISDYVFSNSYKSLLHSTSLINKWNSFNKNSSPAGFPGFLLSLGFILSLFAIHRSSNKLSVRLKFDRESLLFFIISISGLIFSFGPRANFNGNYAVIPMPYLLVMKAVPMLYIIRTPSRWSYIFYLALIYFFLRYFKHIQRRLNHPKILLVLVTFWIFVEYLPLKISTHSEKYVKSQHILLSSLCNKENKVLLEIPVTHLDAGNNIVEGLNYITKEVLASTHHNCRLVNGYGGYDLTSIIQLKDDIALSLSMDRPDKFYSSVNKTGADLLLINWEVVLPEMKDELQTVTMELIEKEKLSPIKGNLYSIN
jgi:hypothetical protein